MWFTSDNAGPAAPEILAALAAANSGCQPGYGADAGMARVKVKFPWMSIQMVSVVPKLISPMVVK